MQDRRKATHWHQDCAQSCPVPGSTEVSAGQEPTAQLRQQLLGEPDTLGGGQKKGDRAATGD